MSTEYRHNIHAMLRSAEAALTVGPQPTDRQAPVYADPHRRGSYTAGAATVGALQNVDENFAGMSQQEMARQLRLCMKEVASLRSELTAEREGRNQLTQLLGKRIKEEVAVELRTLEHSVHREVREIEASMAAKLQESEVSRGVDRRKIDDALRIVKSQERSRFDAAEQLRDSIDDMRVRCDNAVALCTATRAETTQQVEKERAAFQHRLDVELLRYADMHRQQQQQMADTRSSVAKEVNSVSKDVARLVDQVWDDRLKGMSKLLNESLENFKETQEKQNKVVVDLSLKVNGYVKDSKQELQAATADLRERVTTLESSQPLLTARVDRFERKADAVMDSNSRMSAHVDVLKEMSDKAAVQAQRSAERAQKVEDTVVDRDARLLALESQAVALGGLDRLKSDAEGTKRALTRLEGQMESVRQIADRDERLVEQMQRSMDDSLERSQAAEKKAQKVVARVETSEQRLATYLDRIISVESVAERLQTSYERVDSERDALQKRLEAGDHRVRVQSDKLESMQREVRDRLNGVEMRHEAIQEASSRAEAVASGAKKEVDRMEKRLGKVDAGASNAVENVREVQDSLTSQRKDLQDLRKRTETALSQLERSERMARGAEASHDTLAATVRDSVREAEHRSSSQLQSVEGRLDKQIVELSQQLREVSTMASRRPQATDVAGASRSMAQNDEIALDVAATRRKVDKLESRVTSMEESSRILESESVRRHEFTSLRHQLSTMDSNVANIQNQVLANRSQQFMPSNAVSASSIHPSPMSVTTPAHHEQQQQQTTTSPRHRFDESSSEATHTGERGMAARQQQPKPLDVAAATVATGNTLLGGGGVPSPSLSSVAQSAGANNAPSTVLDDGYEIEELDAPPQATEAPKAAAADRAPSQATSSAVSSMHGVKPSAVNFDDSDEEDEDVPPGLGGGSKRASNAHDFDSPVATSTGRPPLHSGEMPPSTATTSALSPQHWRNTKRTPYSDTESEDRSADKTPVRLPTLITQQDSGPSSKPAPKRTPFDSSFGDSPSNDEGTDEAKTTGAVGARTANTLTVAEGTMSVGESGADDSPQQQSGAPSKGGLVMSKDNPFATASIEEDDTVIEDFDEGSPERGGATSTAVPAPGQQRSSLGGMMHSSDESDNSPGFGASAARASKKFVDTTTGDSSSAFEKTAAVREAEKDKKFTKKAAMKSYDDFDDDDDDDDDEEDAGLPGPKPVTGGVLGTATSAPARSGMSPMSAGGKSKKSTTSSAMSRNTADVSVSLTATTEASKQSSRKNRHSTLDDGFDDEDEDLDDDALAKMMGSMK